MIRFLSVTKTRANWVIENKRFVAVGIHINELYHEIGIAPVGGRPQFHVDVTGDHHIFGQRRRFKAQVILALTNLALISRPDITTENTFCWMSVGSVNPKSPRAFSKGVFKFRSSKVILHGRIWREDRAARVK